MTYKTMFAGAVLLVLGSILYQSAQAKNPPQSIAMIDSVAVDSILGKDKVTYVDFWASWCPPCRKSFPWMKTLQDRYRDKGLQVVTINVDKDPAKARKFLQELNSPLPVIFDSTGSLAKAYDLEALPSSFLYARDGTFRIQHEGFSPLDTLLLDSLINSFVSEGKKP
jgi:thiol-disulfide isomerase/thioredoxin